ncbi:MAG: hypothetical protein JJU13_01710 [Balneolaceae bacterium]|nr:hypothetical protein [Balneolaceae bacterium]
MPETPGKENPFDFKIIHSADFILEKYQISDEIAVQIDEIYPEAFKGKKSTIKRLHRLCKKYPRIPFFKNYLSIAYQAAGNEKKSAKINRELLQQHPDYLIAKLNEAMDLIDNNQLDKVSGILGEEMHIHKLYPNRDAFHIEEVSKYYATTIQYFLKANNVDEAELRLRF